MSAIISTCGQYRYRLDRIVDHEQETQPGPAAIRSTIAFFGVNPSTADAEAEDATTRRWIHFARVNGASRYIAGNVFAYRSTDIKKLRVVRDPVGPDNRNQLAIIMAEADILVPCWGAREKVVKSMHYYFDRTLDLMFASGKPVKVFGFTKNGDPLHPLMLSNDNPLQEWKR